ncbi:MAG: hypothetical protein VW878_07140 [Candidatus Poseidoniales archaeon]|jgi:hypothetical protein
MFDTVHNNYAPLGDQFAGPLYTRDLYEANSTFWISPAGEFFVYDDLACWKYEENWDEHSFGFNYQVAKTPTGKHIKLKPMKFSNYISLYTHRSWGGRSQDQPVARLNIRDGKIDSYKITTRGDTTWPE